MVHNHVFGLVLAGGESRRMGHDKALLIRDGRSQLAHVAALLEQVVERVYVSARTEQQQESERSRFELIVDRYNDIGPIAGILSAMDAFAEVDWLVVACDLPNIDKKMLSFLLDNRSDSRPFTAFKSSYDDLPEPLCAVFRPESRAIIQRFVADGMVCPRKMLMQSDTCLLAQPNPSSLDNINTPDDLKRSVLTAAS